MPAILELKSVSKSFGDLHAVSDCSFRIEENTITGLIGPNGAGKTTVYDLVTGLLRCDHGKIYFKHEDVTSLPTWKRASLGIGRTFQLVRVFPELKTMDNVLAALPRAKDNFWDIFTPLSKRKKESHEKAMDLLKLVNLNEKTSSLACDLSYGQQKLLEIIKAVAGENDLLLLDEPAAGVNRTLLHKIIELIKHLKQAGKTIVIIEHDMGFVMNLCEKIIVMDAGKVIAEGSSEIIQKNAKVLEAYLGKKHKFINYAKN